ncbi:MAG: hypothetical protein FWC34_01045 [Bacteroidetes bacterium]|nr:hypothetical protein [Bacteroidota bacterium]MCL2303394.1 hypothetical protein [Lentimicrobiaceae bacterium]
MERYANRSGNSPITYYQINEDSITVYFKGNNKPYTYSYRGAGTSNVETMKKIARSGSGLSTFINRNVRNDYD